jgi:transposase
VAGIGHVEIADQVEDFFGAAAEPDLVFVAVLARHIDGRSPSVGGSAVAQPHQGHLFTIGQFAGYVGELASEAHVDLSQLGPVGLGVRAKPLGQGGLGRLGDDGHALHIAGPTCRPPSPGRFRAGSASPSRFLCWKARLCPPPRARQIILITAERHRLKKLACSRTAGYQQVIRVRIVLDAARGYSNAEISRRRGVVVDTVRLWRGRYADEGMAGLADRHRSGRPPRFTPVQAAEVKALACQLPAETGIPPSRWSCPDLAGEITGRGIAPAMSASAVRRILAASSGNVGKFAVSPTEIATMTTPGVFAACPTTLRAVIAGGGIGGIAAAVALARARIDVRVHEQAQQLAEVGAGVSLAPNGLRVLERLGAGGGIGRVGARYVSAQLRFSDGRAMRHEPYQFARPGRNAGIHRAGLLALLAGQLPPGTVRTGHRCTGFSQDAGSATDGFADGTTATADVVIGADGIHSVLQGFVVAPAKPVFSGGGGLSWSGAAPGWVPGRRDADVGRRE